MVLDLNTTYEEVQKAADVLLPAQQNLRASLKYQGSVEGKKAAKKEAPKAKSNQQTLEEQ